MVVNVKELSNEELERELERLRTIVPPRTTRPRAGQKKKEITVSEDAVQEAIKKLLEGK